VEIFRKDFSDHHDSKREAKILSSSDFVTAASMVQELTSGAGTDVASYVSTNREFATPVCPSALGHLYFSFALQSLLHRLTESGAGKFHAQAHIPT
jgi:hypothetical protein